MADNVSVTIPCWGGVMPVRRGGLTTNTVNVRAALKGGTPLSVTRTVIALVLGVCCAVGIHVNKPLPAPIVAPEGMLPSRLNDSVCGGDSASVADAVKLKVCPSVTILSAMTASWGGVLPPPRVFGRRGVGVVME